VPSTQAANKPADRVVHLRILPGLIEDYQAHIQRAVITGLTALPVPLLDHLLAPLRDQAENTISPVPLDYSIGCVTCAVCRYDRRRSGWLAGCCSRSFTC